MAGWGLSFPGFHRRPQPLLERRLKGMGLSFIKICEGDLSAVPREHVQAVEKVACATFSRFSYLPCAYGAARELCRETLATQGFLRICRTPPRGPSLVPSGQFTLCRQIRLKPKRATIFYSSEVSRQADVAYQWTKVPSKNGGFFRLRRRNTPILLTFFRWGW